MSSPTWSRITTTAGGAGGRARTKTCSSSSSSAERAAFHARPRGGTHGAGSVSTARPERGRLPKDVFGE